jgi:hypothetical protein
MRRMHLIEIHEQPWCPASLRDALTDYLQFAIESGNPYGAIVERLKQSVMQARATRIIDLCSGGGGPWRRLYREFALTNFPIEICLTDKYPNLAAFRLAQTESGGKLSFCTEPINACSVPRDLKGFRTFFSSFHHFRFEDARAILNDAAQQRQGVGVFEATARQPLAILLMFLTPLIVLLVTPLIRPFRWTRLFWTYIFPLVPLIVLWDGVVSCLRTYSPAELRELTKGLGDEGYLWESGEEKYPRSLIPVTYLVGYPSANFAEEGATEKQ